MSRHEERRRSSVLKLSANPLVVRETSISAALGSQTKNVFGLKTRDVEGQENYLPVEGLDYTGLPEFQRHTETTNIELFYDLFFVANLTTFSGIHEINDRKTLTSYIGFFCVLWFTWCQVSLFDVRFVADSVLERAAKGVHLGVMVGLAIVAPNFQPEDQQKQVFQTMSLILMVSRIVLGLQYLLVMWHVRKYQNTKVPFLLIAASNFVAAAVYLGVTFAFGDKNSTAYRSFYVIAIFEIATNIMVSSNWKAVTFKGTHLVQRMSLLTLIILGEGVMTTVQKITTIVYNEHAWDGPTIGTIIAAISIVYLLYMLYFDALPDYHFGSIRQQFWAFLHFPFHLFLVLLVEGIAQFVIWFKMNEVATSLLVFLDIPEIQDGLETNNWGALASAINDTVQQIFDSYPPTDFNTYEMINSSLTTLQESTTKQQAEDTLLELIYGVIHSIYQTYGFAAPESNAGSTTLTAADELQNDYNVIGLVFVYFFVAAGLTLMLMGVLNLLTLPRSCFSKQGLRSPGLWARHGIFFVVGAAIAGLAGLINGEAGYNLSISPWLLPVVVLGLVIVLVAQYVRWPQKTLTGEGKE
ncbi:uncharacterized protein K444DRAFT_589316 [Hyaloscypha bicolor E]|uniref:Low temperature requirement A n=1 Tax=Hyaloscypha bicolor E TaxID=1095630 RepID=A0A2J6TB08_9HELO|nr:uncharacterized protein K444DRAFT_589316 [Hyaloscypha bicolor E]PMD60148.1 hypothetical protein K444DRAFT_589316 [Hyaloscypha bicolor E]